MALSEDRSQFDDWLEEGGPGGEWPEFWEDRSLSDEQERIVAANRDLLKNENEWRKRVAAFEEALQSIDDEKERENTRERYLIRLERTSFQESLNFDGKQFPCSVWLDRAEVKGTVLLDRAEVKGNVSLYNTEVKGTVSLDRAEVKGYVWLYDAEVKGDVSLRGAEVKGNVSLNDAEVKGDVLLNDAEVKGDVSLNRAEVKGNVWLINCIFSASTTVSASDMVVDGSLSVKSRFFNAVNFQRLKVAETARFSGSTFSEAPDFRDAKFNRPPDVAGMVVPRPVLAGWKSFPLALQPGIFPSFKTCFDKDGVEKYRKLKAMAISASDHEMDGEFFAGEMLAKRGVETTSFSGLLANTLYGRVSDYGQSWTRPVGWLLLSWFLFIFVYGLYSTNDLSGFWSQLKFAASFSLLNLLPLVGTLGRSLPWPEDYKTGIAEGLERFDKAGLNLDWLMVLSGLQQIIGILLLFFIQLGLRNRFRLK